MKGSLGRGKVILLGEHAVVYGVPALAAALERGVVASATQSESLTLSIDPWGLIVSPDDGTDLGAALAAVTSNDDRFAIAAEVSLPAGAGLGCSAALGVAVIRAVHVAAGRSFTDLEIAEQAYAWEKIFHGNPSGIDNTMAACGGIARYVKSEPLVPVRTRAPLWLVIGQSGEPASTKEMVANVARHRERDPALFEKNLTTIRALVDNARLALETSDHYGVGKLMNLNHALLSGWMLSTESLEAMCAAAREAGARGAKLTGSGGGGCMIALADDSASAEQIREAIERTDHRAFVVEAGG